MCTAISLLNGGHFFGRNLDVTEHYKEQVTIIPRNYPLSFKKENTLTNHFAFIGMATEMVGTPLFYDGMNECGLCIAGLNFPGNAVYFDSKEGKDNIASFEIIPWLLGRAKNLEEAALLLKKINIINLSFNEALKNSSLHWIISDKSGSLTLEQVESGLKVYKNEVGVLTNNPPFPFQLMHLKDFSYLSPNDPINSFSKNIEFDCYCRGLGAMGLPGDYSSKSRFVKVAFVKENYEFSKNKVSDFFHILESVAFPKGAVRYGDKSVYTVYSSLMDVENKCYYYKTYDGLSVKKVDMYSADLEGNEPKAFFI